MQVEQKLFVGLERTRPVVKQEKSNRNKQKQRALNNNQDLFDESLAVMN
jgi:hypothetical protein